MEMMEGEQLPCLLQRDHPSHDWRPQAGQQKDSACSRNQVLCESDWFGGFRRKVGDPEADQSDAEPTPE